MKQRPYVLTVAGHDPSAGAGVAADVKTLEMNRTLGLAVVTCITYQHEERFAGADWLPFERIAAQIDILLERYHVSTAKIGLVESMSVLEGVLDRLRAHRPDMPIVWDPVLRASAGYRFHEQIGGDTLERICRSLAVVTPNWVEIQELFPGVDPQTAAERISRWCSVLLKGGHNPAAKGYDYLYTADGLSRFRPKGMSLYDKHGSGCVFSAALAAALAQGFPLHRACLRAKNYTRRFLDSAPGLLGVHNR